MRPYQAQSCPLQNLSAAGVCNVSKTTIRQVRHEADSHFGKTRVWCPTGTAIRVRQAGTVTVQGPQDAGN